MRGTACYKTTNFARLIVDCCVIDKTQLLRMSPLIFLDLEARLSLFIRQMLQQHHPEGDRFWRAMLENNLKKDWVSNLCKRKETFLKLAFSPSRPVREKH